MEAPSRGMLRRPTGLLPSATMRASTAPESMGHVAAVVPREEVARNEATGVVGTVVVAGAGAGLAKAMAMPMTGSAVRMPMVSLGPPVQEGVVLTEAMPSLPWAVLVSPAAVASFGTAVSHEMVVDTMAARSEKVAAARAQSLARKQVTHYRCVCCRAMMPKDGGRKCTACGQTQPDTSQLAISEREEARAASRTNTKKGRQRNGKRGANVPQHSLSVAPVSAFEREWQVQLASKKQRVEHETEELAMERCGLSYVDTEDARAAVMESFLQVCLAEVNRQ